MDVNLNLFGDDECPLALATPEITSADRSWCRPSCHSDVVGVDFGKQGMCSYSLTSKKTFRVSLGAEISWLLSRPPGTLLLCEWAHLAVPQTERSLAQFFTESQLIDLYAGLKERSITLLLFPHYHSGPRAREWAACRFPAEVRSDKSDDVNDAKALALYVAHCNGVSLAKPPSTFTRDPRRDYGIRVIGFSNVVLNAERSRDYRGTKFPHVVDLARSIKKRSHYAFVDHRVAVSIAALIATEIDGSPVMFVRGGRTPGVNFWMRYVMRFTPFHHRGGIARSNIFKHRFPAFLVRQAARNGVAIKKHEKFGTFSDAQDRVRRLALKKVREAVADAYRIGVREASQMGFRPYELSCDLLECV